MPPRHSPAATASRSPEGPLPVGRGYRRYSTLRATGTEIAIRTGCTVRSGELIARDGRLFDGVLAATGTALARGQIDARKARRIADRLDGAPLETALDVQALVLTGAGLRSPAQLERDLSRALIEVDVEEASARHRRARNDRRVCRPRVLPDGIAGVWAVLPADSAALLHAALDAVAGNARAAGDPRTADQLRADGLVSLVVGTHDARGGRSGRDSTTRAAVHVDVTVALSTLLGLDSRPGELAGYGAITAEQAAALATGGALRRIVTDPLRGAVLDVGRTRYRPPAPLHAHVIARDRTCARPGCTVPAQRAELDHTVPFGPSRRRDGRTIQDRQPTGRRGATPQRTTSHHSAPRTTSPRLSACACGWSPDGTARSLSCRVARPLVGRCPNKRPAAARRSAALLTTTSSAQGRVRPG